MSVWECGQTYILGYVTRQYLKTNYHFFFHHLTKMSSWTPVTQTVGVAFHDNTAQNWLYLSCVDWKSFLFFSPLWTYFFYTSGFVFFTAHETTAGEIYTFLMFLAFCSTLACLPLFLVTPVCHFMAAESRLWPQPEPWLPVSHSASVGLFSHSICN